MCSKQVAEKDNMDVGEVMQPRWRVVLVALISEFCFYLSAPTAEREAGNASLS